jgi:hypothetical protein
MVDVQSGTDMGNSFEMLRTFDVYKLCLPAGGKFPPLPISDHAKQMVGLFGSTYGCEQRELNLEIDSTVEGWKAPLSCYFIPSSRY